MYVNNIRLNKMYIYIHRITFGNADYYLINAGKLWFLAAVKGDLNVDNSKKYKAGNIYHAGHRRYIEYRLSFLQIFAALGSVPSRL